MVIFFGTDERTDGLVGGRARDRAGGRARGRASVRADERTVGRADGEARGKHEKHVVSKKLKAILKVNFSHSQTALA